MLIISNMGDHVWLITSRHTEPDLMAVSREHTVKLGLTGRRQLVDIWVEDFVLEPDAGTFVWVLVGELDVDPPESTLERRFIALQYVPYVRIATLTHSLQAP